MSAVALQNLLDYLTGTLTMSNRQWLATHLVESNKVEMARKQQVKEEAYVRESLSRAINEVKTSSQTETPRQSAESFFAELKAE